MKQLFQDLNKGQTFIENVPIPKIQKNYVLVRNFFSVISPGTESMLVDFGKGNLVSKALQQPEKVRDVLDKVSTDGLFSTYEAVSSKLSTPIPLGYSTAGEIIESASDQFQKGDLVITNGSHAEIVKVNQNLCAKIPDGVSEIDASFTVISSVAMQSIRLLDPKLGEYIVVFGLGLIGFITAQILRANGCQVLGIDPNNERCQALDDLGIMTYCNAENSEFKRVVNKMTNGHGADGVIISAKSNDSKLISKSANLLRKRGKLILSGTTGLNLNREDFYEKEISFQVSCSYGPGRYEADYEEMGVDYPVGFVRWTEKRNFESVLNLLKENKISFESLKENIIPFEKAPDAYLESNNNLTTILKYSFLESKTNKETQTIKSNDPQTEIKSGKPILGFLGSGNYATRVLIPAFYKQKCKLHTVVSKNGISQLNVFKRYRFTYSSTDEDLIFENDSINTIIISTRHHQHTDQVIKGLKAKKNIFVEKPLAIDHHQFDKISDFLQSIEPSERSHLMIGFNRRFSQFSKMAMKALASSCEPKFLNITINAGYIPKDHWTQDRLVGGGRLIGEACHFIDLSKYLISKKIIKYDIEKITHDTFSFRLIFEDGSISVVNYVACGHKSYPKEKIEIFYEKKTILIDNFRRIRTWGLDTNISKRNFFQDKGNESCVAAFVDSISRNSSPLIPIEDILDTTNISIKLSNEMFD